MTRPFPPLQAHMWTSIDGVAWEGPVALPEALSSG